MLDSGSLSRFTDLARTRLAAGTATDDVLRELRANGLHKMDSIRVVHDAAGVSLADAKSAVHNSPVWADRRADDEHIQDQLWRGLFLMCVLGGGEITEPREWARECRDRRQRATTQLATLAATLPGQQPAAYQRSMADADLGAAFVALVDAGQRDNADSPYWTALATIADTLCLDELLVDESPEAVIRAAQIVRERT